MSLFVALAQFPVTASEEWAGVRKADLRARQREETSAFIRLAQGVVDAIWLDLGALKKGYLFVTILFTTN